MKSSPSIIRRFSGRRGRPHLIDSISTQPGVAGNRSLATDLCTAGELLDFPTDRIIIQQGGADNDLYFIVAGEVAIIINGRRVTTRAAGRHVGEMAVLDPTATRSATVKAIDRTIALRVKEADVTRIGKRHPEFWRHIAVEIAARLRERSKFISTPHADPVIFIGSSSEAVKEATWTWKSLNRRDAVARLWTQGVFQLSNTAIEDLLRETSTCDFAALFLTPDDMTKSRGKLKASPRDNLIFELGLFMGALGRERAFIIVPKGVDIKLPTDLLGVTHLQYSLGPKRTLGRRLQPVSRALWSQINELWPQIAGEYR